MRHFKGAENLLLLLLPRRLRRHDLPSRINLCDDDLKRVPHSVEGRFDPCYMSNNLLKFLVKRVQLPV